MRHSNPRRPFGTAFITASILLTGYVACMPDLDALTAGAGDDDEAGGASSGTGGRPLGTAGSNAAGSAATEPLGGMGGAGSTEPAGGSGGEAVLGSAGESGSSGAATAGESGMGGDGGSKGGGACTTDLATGTEDGATFTDCGACGITCSLENATSSGCAEGACTPACADGFGNCNAATGANDGCETDTSASPTACGACDRACSLFGAQSSACEGGTCQPSCVLRYADCREDDGAVDDGCETDLDALNSCGTDCAGAVECSASEVCNGGSCGAAQGVVVFSVPFTASGQIQRYAQLFASPRPSLANSVLTVRAYAPGATGGSLNVYVSDDSFDGADGRIVLLSELAKGWTDIAVPVGGVNMKFDPILISQINLEVRAEAGPWTEPTLIYVDAMWSSNGQIDLQYTSTVMTMVRSGSLAVENSTLAWSDALP